MEKLFISLTLLVTCFNAFSYDCVIKTDKNGDGNFDHTLAQVPSVLDGDMLFIFKDDSVFRQSGFTVKNIDPQFFVPVDSSVSPTNIDGSRLVVFGTKNSRVIVTAKHVVGTASSFESQSGTAYDSKSAYGILLDYANNLNITCVE
ncbi:MAG: hypothetical protein ACJAS4_003488 [Bacteriovoracaceae bacterium]|jgi:hypothetical protein